MAASCHCKVSVSSGRGVSTICFPQRATAGTVYTNCGGLVVLRHFRRKSHTRVECTLMAKTKLAFGVGEMRMCSGSGSFSVVADASRWRRELHAYSA